MILSLFPRKSQAYSRKGLLRSKPSIIEQCLPPESQIHQRNRDTNIHQKKKRCSFEPETTRTEHNRLDYEKLLFSNYDYNQVREKMCLPLETKHGTVIDLHFIRNLESIIKWCNNLKLVFLCLTDDTYCDQVLMINCKRTDK